MSFATQFSQPGGRDDDTRNGVPRVPPAKPPEEVIFTGHQLRLGAGNQTLEVRDVRQNGKTIDGGAGQDTARFDAPVGEYAIRYDASSQTYNLRSNASTADDKGVALQGFEGFVFGGTAFSEDQLRNLAKPAHLSGPMDSGFSPWQFLDPPSEPGLPTLPVLSPTHPEEEHYFVGRVPSQEWLEENCVETPFINHLIQQGAGDDLMHIRSVRHNGNSIDGGAGTDIVVFNRPIRDFEVRYDPLFQEFNIRPNGDSEDEEGLNVSGYENFVFGDIPFTQEQLLNVARTQRPSRPPFRLPRHQVLFAALDSGPSQPLEASAKKATRQGLKRAFRLMNTAEKVLEMRYAMGLISRREYEAAQTDLLVVLERILHLLSAF